MPTRPQPRASLDPLEPRTLFTATTAISIFATSTQIRPEDGGHPFQVTVYNGFDKSIIGRFNPFPGYRPRINIAAADVNGDKYPEIIAAPTFGPPIIQYFNPITGKLLGGRYVFDPRFTGGVNVAVGDVTGDGSPELVVSPFSAGRHVLSLFSLATGKLERSFFVDNPQILGSTGLALGDLDGDHTPERAQLGTLPV
jgi:hypothetical protein